MSESPAKSHQERVSLKRMLDGVDWREQMRCDVQRGLTAESKSIPSKYLYDARGSELFEEITRLPEYYLTRTETQILEQFADEIVARTRPDELVEIGSGSSRKTELLLEAIHRRSGEVRYVPFDFSDAALIDAAQRLVEKYDWLEVYAVEGDLEQHLGRISRSGRRLVAFLGSTIGNLTPAARVQFYSRVAAALAGEDYFLIGLDLVKDVATLEAAYNDSAGVTAAFSRNVLAVLNRELKANFNIDDFRHEAYFDRAREVIDIGLRATKPARITFGEIDGFEVQIEKGERIHTEISSKFRRPQVVHELGAAGLQVVIWLTDPDHRFALALAQRTEE